MVSVRKRSEQTIKKWNRRRERAIEQTNKGCVGRKGERTRNIYVQISGGWHSLVSMAPSSELLFSSFLVIEESSFGTVEKVLKLGTEHLSYCSLCIIVHWTISWKLNNSSSVQMKGESFKSVYKVTVKGSMVRLQLLGHQQFSFVL